MIQSSIGLSARVQVRLGAFRLDVELQVPEGVLVLVGPNGAGKSTLISAILGAREVLAGRIEIDGTILLDTERRTSVPMERRRLGYVPQDYALFRHQTVEQHLAFALGCTDSAPSQQERRTRIDALLQEFDLDGYRDRHPQTLSGGERQRVALARALVLRPRALLLDEPLAALDANRRAEMRERLGEHLGRVRIPTVMITHDPADACFFNRNIAVMEAGTITQVGSWSELVVRPTSSFVDEFVSSAGEPQYRMDTGSTRLGYRRPA